MSISRRNFIKTAGIVTASAGVLGIGGILTGCGENKSAGAKSVQAVKI
ncbi:MAG: twin-arginine translocation signal domain-containing protein [Selenomonadaceae bacterium]|nr:twin-arginine translocation signal domain-containing protein [Selenomonadaceae bacterium]